MSAATLAERTAEKARGTVDAEGEQEALPVPTPAQLIAQDEPQSEDYDEFAEREYPMPEQVPVHVAWYRVMCDVRAIAKNRKVNEGRLKFSFRGVEDVVQAFAGPMRKHGVIVAPSAVTATYSSTTSKGGASMRECGVVVQWKVIGPTGDVWDVPLASAGEGMDGQDKATAKAEAIALRWFLTTLGMVPTGDPEPEAESAKIERGAPGVSVGEYLAEITNPYTARERFRQIWNELGRHQLHNEVVEYEGQRGTLQALYAKIGNERWPKRQPDAPQHNGHAEGVWTEGCEGCAAESHAIEQRDAGGEA